MNEDVSIEETTVFESRRSHLRAVAFRLLGSAHEADDAVQETWLRLQRSDVTAVENLPGWLTTVVSRICLDQLRSRASRREDLDVDPTTSAAPGLRDVQPLDPAEEAERADAVGRALLVVLDTLAPAERLAFCLHDLFGLSFEEIAPTLGRSSTACRQLASRGRRRVRGQEAAEEVDRRGTPRWSRPSWTRPGTVTSSGCWSCCTPLPSSPPTRSRWPWAHRRCCAAPTRWRSSTTAGPRPPAPPCWTVTRPPSGRCAVRSRRSSASPWRTAGSPRSSCWPASWTGSTCVRGGPQPVPETGLEPTVGQHRDGPPTASTSSTSMSTTSRPGSAPSEPTT